MMKTEHEYAFDEMWKEYVKSMEKSENRTSHFIQWKPDMIYDIEPYLRAIVTQARCDMIEKGIDRYKLYEEIKRNAENYVGDMARDPRLRSHGAWMCFINDVCDSLEM